MDSTVISALIAAASAVLVNIVSNVILSARQTALLEYRINELEKAIHADKDLRARVVVLETRVDAVDDAIRELRTL